MYVAFTALAVVVALRGHAESATHAASTLLIVVLGSLSAGLLSHVVSHLVVYEVLPSGPVLANMLRVTGGALASLLLPAGFTALAVAGSWELERALRAATIALVASLGVIGYLAARRARLPRWQRAVVLLGEVVIGTAVVGLELLAHV